MSLEYTQKITLDLESNSAYTTVSAKSSDQNSRALDIYIQKNGQDYVFQNGSLLQFRLKKPDGTSVIITEDADKYTDEQGIEHPLLHRTSSDPAIIHLIFSGQCLAAAGRGYADIVETLDSSNNNSNDIQIISTVSFILNIMSSPDMSGLISENEFAVIIEYVHEAQDAATSAAASASIAIAAIASSTMAFEYATQASQSATMAIQSANIASDNANIAVGAASNALSYMTVASNSAVIATNSAVTAIDSAFIASNSAVIALDSASIAIQQANIATESASTAISNASIAIEQADIATSMASNANQSMQSAQQYANVASSSAASAQSYASSASSSAYYASQSADLASASAVIAVNAASSAQGYMDIASASAAIAISSAMIAFNSAANASQSAVDAAIYATTASESAVIALQSAIDARSYAATASDSAYISTTNALIASNSATIAMDNATIAVSSASMAIESANTASESALQAINNASIAYESAGIAISSASIALNSANIASDSATIAIDNALIASNSAVIAIDSAGIASSNAEIALNSAAISTSSAATAVGKAEDAEAWSVGQRNGMDVDQSDITYHNNAKYWASQAQYASGEKAPINSPSFTGIPTTPNAAVGTSTSQIANTKYVMDSIAALGEVMVFKGIVNQNSDLPATHSVGWTYKVGTAGTYVDVVCEVGDTIVCINNGTSANNNDWYVLQANIDGAVIGPTGSTDGHVVIFDGSSGKLIKDGYGVATSISNSSNTIPTTEAVYAGLNSKQDTLTFDNNPVQNSNNPVRSGGLYTALNSKQDTLVFDTSPSAGSTNPVTSDGIFNNTITVNHILASETDLNTVTRPGVYGLSSDRTYENYPIDTTTPYGVLEVMPGSSGNIRIQRLTRTTDIFIRYELSIAPITWSNWQRLGATLQFLSVSVATSDWVASSTYSGYAYQAVITCEGITNSWTPEVIFNPPEATSGNFAPVAISGTDTVTIYAKIKPTAAIIIPRIRCEF